MKLSRCVVLAIGVAFVGDAGAQAPKRATLQGKVFVDTLLVPISGVEVTIPELAKAVTTDDKGGFRIEGIPPGSYRAVARKIGFAAYHSTITFDEGASVERAIILPRVAPLDTVRVVGDASLPLSFLENRAVGLGHFLTRADLDAHGDIRLAEILRNVPGLGIVQGHTTQGWILSKRYTIPLRDIRSPRCSGSMSCQTNEAGNPVYYPDPTEQSRGLKAGCYAQVYLDNALLNPGIPAPPVDVNEFSTHQFEAVEYYAGPAQTPLHYSRLNSNCGVLVLHTRRNP